MQDNISSVVILRTSRGYIAHVRFTDPSLNEDVSADTRHGHWGIYNKVNNILYRKSNVFKRGQ